jgi:hypothetical protein
MGKRIEPKKLAVKKETLRKLDAQALKQATGGARPPTQTYTCAAE